MTTSTTTMDVADRGSALARTLTVLVAWFFVAVWLGVAGTLAGAARTPPIGLGLAIAVPLLAFTLDGRLGRPLFAGFLRLDAATVVALQTFRVGGVFFLIAWLRGSLPAGFALPAGLGDVAVGIAAPFVAAAIARRAPHHRAIALVWNVVGVTDLITAISLGVAHSSSTLGVLATAVKTDALARYPFSLIPTFFVPIALILHLLSLRTHLPSLGTLRRGAAPAA